MITFLLPEMPIISAKAYSSDSVDKWGRKANATAQDTINAISDGIGGLQMGISGSNPLVPLSPPIQTGHSLRGAPLLETRHIDEQSDQTSRDFFKIGSQWNIG